MLEIRVTAVAPSRADGLSVTAQIDMAFGAIGFGRYAERRNKPIVVGTRPAVSVRGEHAYIGRTPVERAIAFRVSAELTRRFRAKIAAVPTARGCLEWQGAKTSAGYGVLSLPGKWNGAVYAHRYSYALHNGSIPSGRVICHRCDNPRCVNPDHLFAGTIRENHEDMVRKGRAKIPTKREKPRSAWQAGGLRA